MNFLEFEKTPSILAHVRSQQLEGFVRKVGKAVSRGTLQHTIAELRGFLRFLAVVAKSFPAWKLISILRAFIGRSNCRGFTVGDVPGVPRSIPRATPLGRRDYAMFFLIATYGLRRVKSWP